MGSIYDELTFSVDRNRLSFLVTRLSKQIQPSCGIDHYRGGKWAGRLFVVSSNQDGIWSKK